MTCRAATGAPGFGLIADIGGTNARFALVAADHSLAEVRTLACRDYPDPVSAAEAFLAEVRPPKRPARGAFGVAAAVSGDRIDPPNLAWSFSIEEARRNLKFERLTVINDVLALALALPHLADGDRAAIGGGQPASDAALAAVAPGTGLGVAALVPQPGGRAAVASEAGHATLAAANDREAEVLAVLRKRFDHVSAERVLSGPGLVNLYRALCGLTGAADDPAVTPADVVERAAQARCPHCIEAVRLFSAMLGGFAGNVALTFCARGGVYIGGGVVAKLGAAFDGAAFRERFAAKGRLSAYLAGIPAYLVTHPMPALVGLAQAI